MPETTLNAIEAMLSRRSVPALRLREPGPSGAQIEVALEAALCAPDHGSLRPLRFVLIHGAARERLADLLAGRLAAREPETPAAKIDRVRLQARNAPLVIAVGARILQAHKIPEIEQVLAVGAGVMNLLNAFHALGFGAIWLTGGNAYDPQVAAALGFETSERCLGFVYVGTVESAELPQPRRPERATLVRDWSP